VRVTPLDAARSLQIESQRGLRTYTRGRDGLMEVPERDARALIREGLATAANTAGPTAHLPGGFVCSGCGRHNFFRACGHCGEENADGPRDHQQGS